MKITESNGSAERKILIGMVVNKIVLGRISARWHNELMASKWANLVGGWCVKYFEKYEKAPGRHIEELFTGWAGRKDRDKDTVELVEKFLETLSKEYKRAKKEINPDYLIDAAGTHFNKVKMSRLRDKLEHDLESDNIADAQELLNSYSRIEMGIGAGVDVLRDKNAIRSVFDKKREPLIIYPEALKEFFWDAFERDAFVGIQAPEKRGKSFWLQDIAWRAMEQGRKVAYFEAGDMSQTQVMRRFETRAMGRPLTRTRKKYGPVKVPKSIERHPDKPFAEVEYDLREFKNDVEWKEAYRALKKYAGKDRDTKLKLSCFPNSTLSVNMILSTLEEWERESWIPDVIVIDYADILLHSAKVESRDDINRTWKSLRALSQSRHCLVVTATQAKAEAYEAHTQSQKHFADEKRKHGHVTAMFAINQTGEEKEAGICRLNWVDLRDSELNTSKCVHVAECRSICNIAVHSCF